MTAHDVLVGVKGYLLNYGWKQDGYGRDGGPRCLVGAMASVSGLSAVSRGETRPPAMRVACGILEDEVLGYAASWFNDDEDRTFEEIIDALDKAIVITAPKAPEPVVAASALGGKR